MKDVLTDEFVASHGKPDVMIVDRHAQVCTAM